MRLRGKMRRGQGGRGSGSPSAPRTSPRAKSDRGSCTDSSEARAVTGSFVASRVLLACGAILLAAVGAAGSSTLLDYEKRVVRAAEQITRIKSDRDYWDEGAITARTLLPKSERVQVEGREVEVDNAWLHELLDSYQSSIDSDGSVLEEGEALLDQAERRLGALAGHLQRRAEGGGAIDASERARRILERPEYRVKAENPLAAYIRDVRRRVIEYIRDLFIRLINAVFGTGSEVSWVFKGVVIAGLVAAAYFIARMALRLRRGGKEKKTKKLLGEEIESGVTARELVDSALAAAGTGDFRGAVRKLYVSLLYELSELNLIELEPNTTNREYLARISRFNSLVPAMSYITDRFENCWYGMLPSSREEFSDYLARYVEVVDQARLLSGRAV